MSTSGSSLLIKRNCFHERRSCTPRNESQPVLVIILRWVLFCLVLCLSLELLLFPQVIPTCIHLLFNPDLGLDTGDPILCCLNLYQSIFVILQPRVDFFPHRMHFDFNRLCETLLFQCSFQQLLHQGREFVTTYFEQSQSCRFFLLRKLLLLPFRQ
jgi:hypothetical protein